MRAHVTRDNNTRTIELEVEGLPDIDITEHYHAKPRAIRPDRARINIVDNETRSIVIYGGLVKKSGQASEHVREHTTYSRKAYRDRERLDLAPGWVKELFTQAPSGITSFSWASAEEAQVL